MIPLRADAVTHRFPWLTLTLLAANASVFAWMLRSSTTWLALQGPAVEAVFARLAFVPGSLTAQPWDVAVWVTIGASMFLHAGWLHVLFNMLYLWVFGVAIEDGLGHLWFLVFYLVCGVAATLAQWAIAPASMIPVVGASGAIAGLLGAYLVLFPRTDVTVVVPLFVVFEVATVPAWIVVGLFFVVQLAEALVTLGQPAAGGVAFFAHVGGFLAGFLMAVPVALVTRTRKRLDGGRGR
jgi:membrane associated rhomboid family serine protease